MNEFESLVLKKLDALDNRLTEHMSTEEHDFKSVLAFIESITLAFPTNGDGKPDFAGHNHDHTYRKRSAEEFDDLKKDVQKKVIGTGVLGILTYVFYVVWEAFLRGPHK
jgi:hypothetical protein